MPGRPEDRPDARSGQLGGAHRTPANPDLTSNDDRPTADGHFEEPITGERRGTGERTKDAYNPPEGAEQTDRLDGEISDTQGSAAHYGLNDPEREK